MNPMKSKNIVAKTIQVYAWLNAIAGLILSGIIADTSYSTDGAIMLFAVVLFASFMLYAFGEIIDLLQGIKNNTSELNEGGADEELPEL